LLTIKLLLIFQISR